MLSLKSNGMRIAVATASIAATAALAVTLLRRRKAPSTSVASGDPAQWSVRDVQRWLTTIGACENTRALFAQNVIDGGVLLKMAPEHYVELGVPFGDRVRLQSEVSKLTASSTAPPTSTAAEGAAPAAALTESRIPDTVGEPLHQILALLSSSSFTNGTPERRGDILREVTDSLKVISKRVAEITNNETRAMAQRYWAEVASVVQKLLSATANNESEEQPTAQLLAMLSTFEDVLRSDDYRNASAEQQRALQAQVMQQLAKVHDVAQHLPDDIRPSLLQKCNDVARLCAPTQESSGTATTSPADLSVQLRSLIDKVRETKFMSMSVDERQRVVAVLMRQAQQLRARTAGFSERERNVVNNVLSNVESVLQSVLEVREEPNAARQQSVREEPNAARQQAASSADGVVGRLRALLSSLSDGAVASMDSASRNQFIRRKQVEARSIRDALAELPEEERAVLEAVVGKVERQLAQLVDVPPTPQAHDTDANSVAGTLEGIERLLRSPAFQSAPLQKQQQVAGALLQRLEGTQGALSALPAQDAERAQQIRETIMTLLARVFNRETPRSEMTAPEIVEQLKAIYATLQDPSFANSPDRQSTADALLQRLNGLRRNCASLSPDNQEVLLPHINDLANVLRRIVAGEAPAQEGEADDEANDGDIPEEIVSLVETIRSMRQQLQRALPRLTSTTQMMSLLDAINQLVTSADQCGLPWRSYAVSRNEMQALLQETQNAIQQVESEPLQSEIEGTIREAINEIKNRPPEQPSDLEPYLDFMAKCAEAAAALTPVDIEALRELQAEINAAQERIISSDSSTSLPLHQQLQTLTAQLRHATEPTFQLRALNSARRLLGNLSAEQVRALGDEVEALSSAMNNVVSLPPRVEYVVGATTAELQLLSRINERLQEPDFVAETTLFEIEVIDRLLARLAASAVVRRTPALTNAVTQVAERLSRIISRDDLETKDPRSVMPELSLACLRSEINEGQPLVQYTLHTLEEGYTSDEAATAHLRRPGGDAVLPIERGGVAIVITTDDAMRLAELSMISELLVDRGGYTVVDFVSATKGNIADFVKGIVERSDLPERMLFVILTPPVNAQSAPSADCLERQDGAVLADGFTSYTEILGWIPPMVPVAILHDSGSSLRTIVGSQERNSTLLSVALSAAAASIVNASRCWLFDNIFASLVGELLTLHAQGAVSMEGIVNYCVSQLANVDIHSQCSIGDPLLTLPFLNLSDEQDVD